MISLRNWTGLIECVLRRKSQRARNDRGKRTAMRNRIRQDRKNGVTIGWIISTEGRQYCVFTKDVVWATRVELESDVRFGYDDNCREGIPTVPPTRPSQT